MQQDDRAHRKVEGCPWGIGKEFDGFVSGGISLSAGPWGGNGAAIFKEQYFCCFSLTLMMSDHGVGAEPV